MAQDKCSICGEPLVKLRHVPSALDSIVCPKCGSSGIDFLVPQEFGSCVVDCKCAVCGHGWSVSVVLPKNLFSRK